MSEEGMVPEPSETKAAERDRVLKTVLDAHDELEALGIDSTAVTLHEKDARNLKRFAELLGMDTYDAAAVAIAEALALQEGRYTVDAGGKVHLLPTAEEAAEDAAFQEFMEELDTAEPF